MLFRSSDGEVAWTLKAEDGASRALRPVLGRLFEIDELRTVSVVNSLGEVVGSVS